MSSLKQNYDTIGMISKRPAKESGLSNPTSQFNLWITHHSHAVPCTKKLVNLDDSDVGDGTFHLPMIKKQRTAFSLCLLNSSTKRIQEEVPFLNLKDHGSDSKASSKIGLFNVTLISWIKL